MEVYVLVVGQNVLERVLEWYYFLSFRVLDFTVNQSDLETDCGQASIGTTLLSNQMDIRDTLFEQVSP